MTGAAAKPGCPYVGLVPFTPADERFFFGRERETRLVINNLFASRLTLLYGPSGVGKSSVLGAGVLAELARRSAGEETARRAPVYVRRWQGDPLAAFIAAVRSAVGQARPRSAVSEPAAGEALVDWLARLTGELGLELLLLFDQFEEYFVYHQETGRVVREPFARQLAAMVERPELPVSFLLGLRDDALARLDRFKALIPDLFDNYLRLEPLSDAAAKEAIEKPLERWNEGLAAREQVRLGKDLVEYVVAQVRRDEEGGGRGRPAGARAGIQAPLLQLVMKRLWTAEIEAGQGRSRELRVATLERELGGAEGIVEAHLDAVMADLTAPEREICGRMFEYLVTPSGAKIALSAADLADFAKVGEGAVKPLLMKLAGSQKRLLATVAPLVARGEELYEIYHDALGRAVLAWQQRWAAARERAKARRLILVTLAFALIAALAVGASVWALRASREAAANATRAEENAARAEEKEKEATRLAEETTKLAEDLAAANSARLAEEQARLIAEGKAEEAARVGEQLADAQQEQEALARRLAALGSEVGVSEGTDLEQVVSGLKDENEALKRRLASVANVLDASAGAELETVAATRMSEIADERARAEKAEMDLKRAAGAEQAEKDLRATPKVLKAGDVLVEKAADMRLRYVPPGRFAMGSPEGEAGRDNSENRHQVELTRGFWLAETEVTQGQWRKLMDNNPSEFDSCGDDCPVERVSWWDAVTFANLLSLAAGLEPCYQLDDCIATPGKPPYRCRSARLQGGLDCGGYRLPTEAEWEYAARSGTTTAIYTGNLTVLRTHYAPELDMIAWYGGNSGVVYKGGGCPSQNPATRCGTHPVGGKAANAWGLHDMLGNVWEWTGDWNATYPAAAVTDPTGPESGKQRVFRGGSWISDARGVRAAHREALMPDARSHSIGFRVCRGQAKPLEGLR